MRRSMTEESARVDVSPRSSSPNAILRSSRRMILPLYVNGFEGERERESVCVCGCMCVEEMGGQIGHLRVFGSDGAITMMFGCANGPMPERTCVEMHRHTYEATHSHTHTHTHSHSHSHSHSHFNDHTTTPNNHLLELLPQVGRRLIMLLQ